MCGSLENQDHIKSERLVPCTTLVPPCTRSPDIRDVLLQLQPMLLLLHTALLRWLLLQYHRQVLQRRVLRQRRLHLPAVCAEWQVFVLLQSSYLQRRYPVLPSGVAVCERHLLPTVMASGLDHRAGINSYVEHLITCVELNRHDCMRPSRPQGLKAVHAQH
jgi:hypothetical protein